MANFDARILDRIPPHDDAAEKAIIGCIILDPSCADEASARLLASDFYDSLQGQVYDAMLAMHEMGIPLSDTGLLFSRLKKYGLVASGFGESELAKCALSVPNTAHLNHYVEVVLNASQHRSAIESLVLGLGKLYETAPDVGSIGQWVVGKITQIEARSTIDLVTLKEAAVKAKDRMQDCISKGIGEGLSTGLRCIDETIGGLCSSEMVVLAARPGGGKTALGMQIAVNVAQNGVGVLFVSLEMEDYEIASRTLCAVSGISSKAIRIGTISQEQVDGLDQFIDSLDYPVVFYAPSTAGIRHIAAATRVAKSRQNIGLVVIDYLQKITPTDTRKPRHEQLEEISAAIKSRIAKEYKVPVLALCQLSRDSGGRPPRLEDLKGSGAIEQDADVVIGIHNAEVDTNAKELYILKNRHGEVGTLRVKWAAAATRFEDELLTEMT